MAPRQFLKMIVLVWTAVLSSFGSVSGHEAIPFSPSDKKLTLQGPWRFRQGDDPSWSRKEYDDVAWELVEVPDLWIARDLDGLGTGWYRTWIVVTSIDSSDKVSLWARGISSAGEVFWDGNFVGRCGTFAREDQPELTGGVRHDFFELGTILTPGPHLLAIRVSNWRSFSGGIDEAPLLGFSNYLLWRLQRSKTVFGFLAGVFFLSCIHLLILFTGDRAHKENLYFALLCLASTTFIVVAELPEALGLVKYGSLLFQRIGFLSLLSLPVLMYLFLAHRFGFDVRWLKRLVVIVSACFALPYVLPMEYHLLGAEVLEVRDLWIQFSFFISLYVVVWAVWKKKHGSKVLVAGVLAIAIGAIASFEANDSIWGFSGASLFIVLMTVSLSREMVRIQREVRNTRDTFRLFVPEPVLERIAKSGLESIRLGGAEEAIATILFVDIKSFTSIAERLSPNQTLDFLNSFMQRMQPLITAQGGFINQFVGDEIMAIFHRPGHGAAAVETAVTVRRELNVLNIRRKERGESPIDVGIGINSGPIIWGTIGSEIRMESAVIGDPVNLAARLQGLTRQYGVLVLGSEHVVQQIPDMSKYAYREVDIVQVKGKTEAVAVYEFFDGDPEPLGSQKRESIEPFMQGIVRYRASEWTPAENLFTQCLKICPGDSVAQLYINRCRAMRTSPPDLSWVGVTVHERK